MSAPADAELQRWRVTISSCVDIPEKETPRLDDNSGVLRELYEEDDHNDSYLHAVSR